MSPRLLDPLEGPAQGGVITGTPAMRTRSL
jgi:hypothetical protein